MDLSTHLFFGVAIGLVFFGHPEIALLIGLGAILSDLDREYWFVPSKVYQDEQYHRAGLHNVFIMALGYLVSPFFSLGIFLHVLLDSFTTSKDRGCEWFWPLSRLVKRGRYDADGNEQPLNPDERVYFYQEDPKGLIEHADPDLREPGPTPWRRVYGPALNSRLLDRGFLLGSVALLLVWLLAPDGSHLTLWSNNPFTFYVPYLVGYASLAVIYIAGDLDRRDRDKPLMPQLSFIKKPLFVIGVVLLVTWLGLYRVEILTNIETILASWATILLGAVGLTLACLLIIKWETRKGRAPAIV